MNDAVTSRVPSATTAASILHVKFQCADW